MIISDDTSNIVDLIEQNSKFGLRKKNDFSVVLEICVNNNLHEFLNKIIFTGTSIWNIHQVISKNNASTDNIHHLKIEFENQIDIIIKLLQELISKIDDKDISNRFDEIYFQPIKGSVLNLLDLSYDLSRFKQLQNKYK